MMNQSKSLALDLLGELFQTERSAVRHCAKEAERLGEIPAAQALRAVAAHAARAEHELEALAKARGREESALGKTVGTWFSVMRDGFADLALTSEQSYRATLLGMRHGGDVVDLFGASAEAEADPELAKWASDWLRERKPLIEACAAELRWFAQHPERALGPAKGGDTPS